MSLLTEILYSDPPACIAGVCCPRTARTIVDAHLDEVMSHRTYRQGASWAIQHLRSGDPHRTALMLVAHIPAFQVGRVSLAEVERSARGNAILERDRHLPQAVVLPHGTDHLSRKRALPGFTTIPTRGMVDPGPLLALLDRDLGPLLVDAGVTPASRQILAPWLGLWLAARLDGRWPEPWAAWATNAVVHKRVLDRFRKSLAKPLGAVNADLPGQARVERLLFGSRGTGRGRSHVTGWLSGRLAGERPSLGPLVLAYAGLDPDWPGPRIARRTLLAHGGRRAEALWPNVSNAPIDDFVATLGLAIGLSA